MDMLRDWVEILWLGAPTPTYRGRECMNSFLIGQNKIADLPQRNTILRRHNKMFVCVRIRGLEPTMMVASFTLIMKWN